MDGAIKGLPAGSVVGWTQFVLTAAKTASASGARFTKPVDAGNGIRLASDMSTVSIDKATGLVSYQVNGKKLLKGGTPNFWRGLTDSDLDIGIDKCHAIWKQFTEQRILRRLVVGTAQVKVLYSFGAGAVHWENTYAMTREGVVHVRATFTPLAANLPDPLRLGLRFDTNADLDSLGWYGRGPDDTYSDRRTGSPIAIYKGKLADQYHGYIRPQESGNKTDVRWMSPSGVDGSELKIPGNVPLSVNALPFPYEDLYARPRGTWKSSEIRSHGKGSLLVDLAQAGVGGDTGWDVNGRPHPRYRIRNKPATYSFTISSLAAK